MSSGSITDVSGSITDVSGFNYFRNYMDISGATDVSESPYILTFDQLMTSSAAILQKETADRAALGPFLHPNAQALNPAFIRRVNAGFPAIFVVLSITLSPPAVCSDSIRRNLYEYISYLIGKDLGAQTAIFNEQFDGMDISYSISANTLNLHVSKI